MTIDVELIAQKTDHQRITKKQQRKQVDEELVTAISRRLEAQNLRRNLAEAIRDVARPPWRQRHPARLQGHGVIEIARIKHRITLAEKRVIEATRRSENSEQLRLPTVKLYAQALTSDRFNAGLLSL